MHCRNLVAVFDTNNNTFDSAVKLISFDEEELTVHGKQLRRYKVIEDKCKVSPIQIIFCYSWPSWQYTDLSWPGSFSSWWSPGFDSQPFFIIFHHWSGLHFKKSKSFQCQLWIFCSNNIMTIILKEKPQAKEQEGSNRLPRCELETVSAEESACCENLSGL